MTDGLSLVDVVILLADVVESVDMADEQVTAARHRINDGPTVVALHAVGDDLTQAWAHAKSAHHRLRDIVAGLP